MINFPINPVQNQIHSLINKSWMWSGTRWVTLALVNTDRVPEGSNLYFTNTRTIAALSGSDSIILASNGQISANLTITGVPSAGGLTQTLQNNIVDLGTF